MGRSFLYCVNEGPQAVGADGTVSPGTIIRRYGYGATLNGDGISIMDDGYFAVDVNITAEPTAATQITAVLCANGTPLPGANASVTPSAAGASVVLQITGAVRRAFYGEPIVLTVRLDSAADVTNAAFRVVKE